VWPSAVGNGKPWVRVIGVDRILSSGALISIYIHYQVWGAKRNRSGEGAGLAPSPENLTFLVWKMAYSSAF